MLVVLGVLFGAAGAWLAIQGGPWVHAVAGLGVGLGLMGWGVMLARRCHVALGVYAALLVVTVVWSLWEVGPDRWALVPRGVLSAVIGLWLLAPWIGRPLGTEGPAQTPAASMWRGLRGWVAAAVLVVVAIAVASILRGAFEVARGLSGAPVATVGPADRTPGPGRADGPTAGGRGPAHAGKWPRLREAGQGFMPPARTSQHTGQDSRGASPLDRLLCRSESRRMGGDGPDLPPSARCDFVHPGEQEAIGRGGMAPVPVRRIMVRTLALLTSTYRLVTRTAP